MIVSGLAQPLIGGYLCRRETKPGFHHQVWLDSWPGSQQATGVRSYVVEVLGSSQEMGRSRMSESSVVIYRVGSRWVRELPLQSQDQAIGHIRFIRSLLDSGVARLAGPFARLDQRLEGDTVGIIVFDAPASEASALVSADPAVKAGLLAPQAHTFHPVS